MTFRPVQYQHVCSAIIEHVQRASNPAGDVRVRVLKANGKRSRGRMPPDKRTLPPPEDFTMAKVDPQFSRKGRSKRPKRPDPSKPYRVKTINVSMTPADIDLLKRLCARTQTQQSFFIRQAIRYFGVFCCPEIK